MFSLVTFILSSVNAELLPEYSCVIDRCESNTCVVETPVGSVEVRKKTSYKEGAIIECPVLTKGP